VEDADFTALLRVLNTNVSGSRKVMYALCQIRGIGRRFANLICKKVSEQQAADS
jgi:ribosomal protein S13